MDSMAGVDVLLLPTTPTTAPPLSELVSGAIVSGHAKLDVVTATTGLTMPFSLTGQPSLSVPAGLDANGLPVGLQIVGRHFSEAMVLRVGAAIEAMAAFDPIPPRLEMPNSRQG